MAEEYYNYFHKIVHIAPVPQNVMIWNIIDFGHVNFVHKKTYKYVKVLAKHGNVTFLEYGVNQFLNRRIPIVIKHYMWHQYEPPGTVTHLSKSQFGTTMKVVIKATEFTKDNKKYTEVEHSYSLRLPFFLKPFKKLVTHYIEKWGEILWQEDLNMCLRRHDAVEKGFKDNPMDTLPKAPEGLLAH